MYVRVTFIAVQWTSLDFTNFQPIIKPLHLFGADLLHYHEYFILVVIAFDSAHFAASNKQTIVLEEARLQETHFLKTAYYVVTSVYA